MSENTMEVEIDSIEIQTGGLTSDDAFVTFGNGASVQITDRDEKNNSAFSTERFAELKSRKDSGNLGSAKVTVYTSNITPESKCALKELI